jgi:hypothetical protein
VRLLDAPTRSRAEKFNPAPSIPNAFLCASDTEWAAWLEWWEQARAPKRATDDPVRDFCGDCPAHFQAEMVRQGLCIRRPAQESA